MRRLCLHAAFLILIFSPFISFSQTGFHIGVGGSLNSSWVISQNNFETLSDCSDPLIKSSELAYELTLGYTAGGMIGYNFSEKHGIQLGMQYSKAGQAYQDGFTTSLCPDFTDVRRTIDLTYFQIPIQYKLNGGSSKRINPYALIGIQFGFLIRSDEEVLISNIAKENFQVAMEDKFRYFDFGLVLDGGFDFYLDDDVFINAGLTALLGLSDINGEEVRDFVSKNDEKYKASRNYKLGLHIGIHYLFQSYRRRSAW